MLPSFTFKNNVNKDNNWPPPSTGPRHLELLCGEGGLGHQPHHHGTYYRNQEQQVRLKQEFVNRPHTGITHPQDKKIEKKKLFVIKHSLTIYIKLSFFIRTC